MRCKSLFFIATTAPAGFPLQSPELLTSAPPCNIQGVEATDTLSQTSLTFNLLLRLLLPGRQRALLPRFKPTNGDAWPLP